MKKFLHTLQPNQGGNKYLLAGQVWDALSFSQWEKLYTVVGNARLAVEMSDHGKPFRWECSVILAEGADGAVCFTHYGSAESVDEACVAAIQYAPEVLVLEYLGEKFSCYEETLESGAKRWVFAVAGERAEVVGPFRRTKDDAEYFTWKRYWGPAKAFMERFCGGYCGLEGKASTLRGAMIEAVDAPEMFKRACGELVATLSGGSK